VVPCSFGYFLRNLHPLSQEGQDGIPPCTLITTSGDEARCHSIKESLFKLSVSASHGTTEPPRCHVSYMQWGRSHVPLAVPGARFPLQIDNIEIKLRDQDARSPLLRWTIRGPCAAVLGAEPSRTGSAPNRARHGACMHVSRSLRRPWQHHHRQLQSSPTNARPVPKSLVLRPCSGHSELWLRANSSLTS
jgi:hypothetical protein